MGNGLADALAPPGFAPREWQSVGPPSPIFGNKPAVTRSPDLYRIMALPRREPLEQGSERARAMVRYISDRYRWHNPRCQCAELAPGRVKAGLNPCITELREVQAAALYEIAIVGGMLGPIGVGHGKTILDLLAVLAVPNCKVAALLVPPKLVEQLIRDYQHIGQHFRMPSLVVHGKTWTNIIPGAPVLHVFPYSRLQRVEAADFLERLAPDTIIADEVHMLRNTDSAGTSRVMRYFYNHPETRFCGWSGSLSDASIEDYAHLSYLALRHRSPLPTETEIIKEWASALDANDWPAPPGALLELCAPGEHVTEGFHRRLVETIGVVHTTTAAIDAELEINERPAPEIPNVPKRDERAPEGYWPGIRDALDMVRKMVRPDGEELIDQLSVSRVARELACGFFYRWRYPFIDGRPQDEDTIRAWLNARKAWHKELRDKLKNREEHLDSPLLCARAAARAWGYEAALEHLNDRPGTEHDAAVRAEAMLERAGRLPLWRSKTYPKWREIRNTVVYETEAVRVDDYLARDAAAWGLQNHGIIWYDKREFGAWVGELSGLTVHGGGPDASRVIAAERGERSIVCSIQSHGTGRDGLQLLYHRQLVANPPSSATTWEQMLGRLHRIGQVAPIVYADFYRHTPELRSHVDKALARALYVQNTLGAAQKLRSGFRLVEDYDDGV